MDEKKTYSEPSLLRFGSVADLTRSGTSILGDGIFGGVSSSTNP